MRNFNRPAHQRTIAALGMLALATIAEAGLAPDPCGALRARNSELSAQLVERDSELARLRLEIAALRSEQRSETAPLEAGGARRAPFSNLNVRRRQCQGPTLPGQSSLECSSMAEQKPVDGGPPNASPHATAHPHAPAHTAAHLSQAARKSERIVSCEHGRACASPWHAIDLVATRRLQSASVLTVTFFVADPCQWAGDGQCDVPGACEAGDYADCSASSIAPSPPLAGRRLCIVGTSPSTSGCVCRVPLRPYFAMQSHLQRRRSTGWSTRSRHGQASPSTAARTAARRHAPSTCGLSS
jgi:hypothetical protein